MERLVFGAWVVTGPAACDDPNQPPRRLLRLAGFSPTTSLSQVIPCLRPGQQRQQGEATALLHHAPPVRVDQRWCYPTSTCGIHCARVAAQSRKPNPPLSP